MLGFYGFHVRFNCVFIAYIADDGFAALLCVSLVGEEGLGGGFTYAYDVFLERIEVTFVRIDSDNLRSFRCKYSGRCRSYASSRTRDDCYFIMDPSLGTK